MIVYPAIDLIGGQCVRLAQGNFNEVTHYSADPAEALSDFAAGGAQWAHIVDLDGARSKAPRQHPLILGLAAAAQRPMLQVAGGLRTRDQLARLFDAGIERAVVGSLAVRERKTLERFFIEFGSEKIVLALDVRITNKAPIVATHGWLDTSGLTLWEVAGWYPEMRHLLLTDISRDGMLTGPNVELITNAVSSLPGVAVQASGGVSSLTDLERLRRCGAAGAIVGKALWERRFSLAEAIDNARA